MRCWPGERTTRFFVVKEGAVEIVQPSGDSETLIAVCGAGQFTGEVNMLSGQRSLVQLRANQPGEVIELHRERLLALVQTDSELGDILMRAFILRRVELIAQGLGNVVLVGSNNSPGTLRIREFLTRNGYPYASVDVERDSGVQDLLDRFHVGVEDVPIVICRRPPEGRGVQFELAIPVRVHRVDTRGGQRQHPPYVLRRDEVPGGAHHVSAQDGAVVEFPLDGGIGRAFRPQAQRPFRARKVLRLRCDEPADDVRRPFQRAPFNALISQALVINAHETRGTASADARSTGTAARA